MTTTSPSSCLRPSSKRAVTLPIPRIRSCLSTGSLLSLRQCAWNRPYEKSLTRKTRTHTCPRKTSPLLTFVLRQNVFTSTSRTTIAGSQHSLSPTLLPLLPSLAQIWPPPLPPKVPMPRFCPRLLPFCPSLFHPTVHLLPTTSPKGIVMPVAHQTTGLTAAPTRAPPPARIFAPRRGKETSIRIRAMELKILVGTRATHLPGNTRKLLMSWNAMVVGSTGVTTASPTLLPIPLLPTELLHLVPRLLLHLLPILLPTTVI